MKDLQGDWRRRVVRSLAPTSVVVRIKSIIDKEEQEKKKWVRARMGRICDKEECVNDKDDDDDVKATSR